MFIPYSLYNPLYPVYITTWTQYNSFSNFILLGNEILHRIIREKFLKFSVELGRQRLVAGQNQRRLIQSPDHIGHCKCLVGAGNTEQGFKLVAFLKAFDMLVKGLELVASKLTGRLLIAKFFPLI